MVSRDAASQQQATPNAAGSPKSDAIDDVTRTGVLAARDAIWRAWFAHDTAALRRLLPRSTTAGEGGGWETRKSEVFVRTDGIWQNPFWYLGPR
jgi:hypothetical protein